MGVVQIVGHDVQAELGRFDSFSFWVLCFSVDVRSDAIRRMGGHRYFLHSTGQKSRSPSKRRPISNFIFLQRCRDSGRIPRVGESWRNKALVTYVRGKHGLCQSQLLKFINGLFDAETGDKRSAQAFFRRVPVKFSSTIHGGTKKKKRPVRALFFAIFFTAPDVGTWLPRRLQALRRGCDTRAYACRFRSCRRCCRKAALAVRNRWSAWRSSTPCPTTYRP